MRLDYINPIVDSAVAVLSEFIGAPVERGAMQLHRDESPTKEIITVIGMAGEVEGRIMFEMDRDAAIGMAGLMNQEHFTDLTPLALDTLMELTNVMIARAVSSLNDKGFAFRLTPPLIFSGNSLSIFNTLNLETLFIPLQTKLGNMNLNVALRMKGL